MKHFTQSIFTILFLFFVVAPLLVLAQPSKKQKGKGRSSRDPFLNTQWWVGIKAGANLTKAHVAKQYSVYNSTVDPNTDVYDKKYDHFNNSGGQAGIEITYYHQGFSASFQPNYRRMNFNYTTKTTWQDALNPSYSYTSTISSLQKLDYFELPLVVRYEPIKSKLRPFVQVGVYYSFLNNAFKSTEIKIQDVASGSVNEYSEQPISIGAKSLFIKSNIGWIAGVGFSYPFSNVRLAFDISYRRNTNIITSAANRYSNDRITGTGDIMDDVKLRNIAASVSILIPLRFIMKGSFKAE